jgi:hypothetical protein
MFTHGPWEHHAGAGAPIDLARTSRRWIGGTAPDAPADYIPAFVALTEDKCSALAVARGLHSGVIASNCRQIKLMSHIIPAHAQRDPEPLAVWEHLPPEVQAYISGLG